MQQLRLWAAVGFVGIVAAAAAWIGVESVGYDAQMGAGISVAVGVTLAALTSRWIEKRRQARALLAKFMENSTP